MEPNHLLIRHCTCTSSARLTHIQDRHPPPIATEMSVIPSELDPSCFRCHLGEGDSTDSNFLQCERCLRWIDADCLPRHIPIEQLLFIEGWICHECDPPSTTNPCLHQSCTLHFAPTPHTKSTIKKCIGGKESLYNFQATTTTTP
jgi:hypothetical protein